MNIKLIIISDICNPNQVEDVHKGIYNGLSGPENKEENQCAIVLTEATIEDQGIWTCKVYIQGTVLMASKNLYIAGNNRNNHDNENFTQIYYFNYLCSNITISFFDNSRISLREVAESGKG